MTLLMNPMVLRMGLLLFVAMAAFGFALFVIRRLRKNLVSEPEPMDRAPLTVEGLPVHAYHAVIQQLKQQKHELTSQQLSERRKAKASDTLSSTILTNLSCGVLFLNNSGLVRQANPAARQMLGFASPMGLHCSDLFRSATMRSGPEGNLAPGTIEQALAPAFTGKAAVRGLLLNYVARNGESHMLEVTASPVLAEDASLMGTTLVLTDKTDIERVLQEQRLHREISAELALGLRASLTVITGYAQQLSNSHVQGSSRQLADDIAQEAAQLDRTVVGFLGGARAAVTSSQA